MAEDCGAETWTVCDTGWEEHLCRYDKGHISDVNGEPQYLGETHECQWCMLRWKRGWYPAWAMPSAKATRKLMRKMIPK